MIGRAWGVRILLVGVVGLAAQGCNYAWVRKDQIREWEQAAARWKQKFDETDSYYQAQLQANKDLQAKLDAALKAQGDTGTTIAALREANQALAQKMEAEKQAYERRIKELEDKAAAGASGGPYRGRPTMRLAGSVLFDPGKAVLKDQGKRLLDELAPKLANVKGALLIAGHTDSQPIRVSGWDSNFQLSGARALAVLEYLAKKGVPEQKMHFAGFGQHQLVMRGGREDQEASRRVEVILLDADEDLGTIVAPRDVDAAPAPPSTGARPAEPPVK